RSRWIPVCRRNCDQIKWPEPRPNLVDARSGRSFGRSRGRLDELGDPLVAAPHGLAIELFEFGGREGVGRWARHQGLAPRLEAREAFDMAELPDAVEEKIALQERRVGGIDQSVFGAIEEGAA